MKETHEKDKLQKDAMNRVFNHIMEGAYYGRTTEY